MTEPTMPVLGALALETVPRDDDAPATLPQREAGELAGLVARDLATLCADAAALELATVGAHYDPVEVLRPGWPLHRELHQLAARAPGGPGDGEGRIVAFGSHGGVLPGALAPSPEHAGGPLRVVPLVLDGDPAVAARVGEAFERELLERGMAGAETALFAQGHFRLRVEHARYLTVHDLCAMVSMQYQHAGLASLWPVIEAALLSPSREQWIDAAPEPLLHYADGEARIALFDPDGWRRRYAADDAGEGLDRRFALFEARQRQFAAVLAAHAIPVTFVHCPGKDAPDL